MKFPSITILAVVSVLLVGASAHGAVFDEKSPEQKLRADVASQVTAYTKCLATALISCEKTGASSSPECSLANGTVLAPADPKGKFAAAVAKCDAKLDYDRKGPKGNSSVQNYELIGCPTGTGGPRLADMNEFEEIARDAKPVIDSLASLLPLASGCSDTKTCADAAKLVLGYATSFGKCQTGCENDYKGKKGNGGRDDDPARCDRDGDPRVQLCIDKARVKFIDKAASWPFGAAVLDNVESTIDAQSDALFNVAPSCL